MCVITGSAANITKPNPIHSTYQSSQPLPTEEGYRAAHDMEIMSIYGLQSGPLPTPLKATPKQPNAVLMLTTCCFSTLLVWTVSASEYYLPISLPPGQTSSASSSSFCIVSATVYTLSTKYNSTKGRVEEGF
ncbi:uncharacterized protein PADG_11185 [Paracoccidioides brasiliensis Pb18]|uniref:Uncharacterized protein n=1 Tax=Paracoccidioides brasiliensis (strain Pb18) TaxID=502780 RepID=A0A0A0HW11_PARBD|nr:uncharacterized protein PADG_11185 [Paracoccidioides brasiliensis Pb18]KGM92727.1 hypothetical protein PADG_11185 [Paracoccidioides brasiliensis Pb18]